MRPKKVVDFIQENNNLQRQKSDNRDQLRTTGQKTINGEPIYSVPIASILMDVEALQPRNAAKLNSAAHFASKNHVAQLRKPLLNPKNELEPIIITRIASAKEGCLNRTTNTGYEWAVVDGFHRLMAYRTSAKRDFIPAVIFDGSPKDAVLLAIKSNNKDKLPMSAQEKLSTAWTMFVIMKETKGQSKTILELGVSRGTLQKFRKQAKLITDDIASGKLADGLLENFEWLEARNYPEIWEPGIWDEDAQEAYITKVSEKLFKAFGHTLKKASIDLLSQALQRHLGENQFNGILEYNRDTANDFGHSDRFAPDSDF
jgi:hypothetical protein